jgi:hypothetical protein
MKLLKIFKIMSLDIEKLKAILATEEGQKEAREFFGRYRREEEILNSQIERFHQKYKDSISDIIEKIVAKYESDKYKDRWYSRGIMPQEELYWFLLGYAKKYGRECTEEELKVYENSFSGYIFIVGDYVIQSMSGMGGCVKIEKIIK